MSDKAKTKDQLIAEVAELRETVRQLREEGIEGRRTVETTEKADADIYKNFFAHAAEGFFQSDRSGRLIMLNQALVDIFGYGSFTEMQQATFIIKDRLFKEPERYNELVQDLLRAGLVENFEALACRKNGEDFWVSINAQAVHDAEGLPVLFQGSIQDISHLKSVESRLLHGSFHDPLTGLVTRAMFLDLLDKTIARAKRREEFSFALLYLDIDRFRMINESLGQQGGDELLRELSKILIDSLRIEDTCARLGGDEFALILSDVFQVADALRVIERINVSLTNPFEIRGQEVFISLSTGIVMSGTDYSHPEDMLGDADSAMFRARNDLLCSFAVFNEAMQKEAIERLRVETDLRKALSRNELHLYYQPIISLRTGEIERFEALLRWERPGFGLVSPSVFIPLLEETGLIIPTGEWVLKEACRQARTWQEKFPAHKELMISVNVSAKQLGRPDLPSMVAQALEDSGITPSCLELEITESVVMEQPELTEDTLHQLKSLGLSLSIDDFGTGYSSLAYLHRLPADVLKIDKSFISGMKDEHKGVEIVRAIMAISHTLSKQVIAEGVETSWQLAQLIDLECEYVQGYFFSKPVTADEAEFLMAQGLKMYNIR